MAPLLKPCRPGDNLLESVHRPTHKYSDARLMPSRHLVNYTSSIILSNYIACLCLKFSCMCSLVDPSTTLKLFCAVSCPEYALIHTSHSNSNYSSQWPNSLLGVYIIIKVSFNFCHARQAKLFYSCCRL